MQCDSPRLCRGFEEHLLSTQMQTPGRAGGADWRFRFRNLLPLRILRRTARHLPARSVRRHGAFLIERLEHPLIV
jgi:hypothetical protein